MGEISRTPDVRVAAPVKAEPKKMETKKMEPKKTGFKNTDTQTIKTPGRAPKAGMKKSKK